MLVKTHGVGSLLRCSSGLYLQSRVEAECAFNIRAQQIEVHVSVIAHQPMPKPSPFRFPCPKSTQKAVFVRFVVITSLTLS